MTKSLNYKYSEILEETKTILNNVADNNRLRYHIIPVVDNALQLATKLNADREVVELAAYFLDYTRCIGDRDNHHNTSADFAQNFLRNRHFPEMKINLVGTCIRNHRASMQVIRNSIEERIIATADAMAVIQEPLPLFYTWYGIHKEGLTEGALAIESKIQRAWNKIYFDFIKDELKDQYEGLIRILKTK